MKRNIIHIDKEKCNGCGACVTACHEGAIVMKEGKAVLLRDDYCDGLGDCLPVCPTGAITFEQREAAAYDDEAVKARQALLKKQTASQPSSSQPTGCPGMRAQTMNRAETAATAQIAQPVTPSQLTQWPVQIKLAPTNAPYFDGANLLIAADCTAYARADFHERFIKNHVTLIGCPKLDMTDYADKLTDIFTRNDIRRIHVVRMQVPCCGGITAAVESALARSGKDIPLEITVISVDGQIV